MCWAFFDACVEPTNETIGTTVLGAAFGMHTELLRLIRLMQGSRMGLYIHEGAEGRFTLLRDLAGLPDVPESRPHSDASR